MGLEKKIPLIERKKIKKKREHGILYSNIFSDFSKLYCHDGLEILCVIKNKNILLILMTFTLKGIHLELTQLFLHSLEVLTLSILNFLYFLIFIFRLGA